MNDENVKPKTVEDRYQQYKLKQQGAKEFDGKLFVGTGEGEK